MLSDNEDFDWEAAVAAIDAACNEATKQSSSSSSYAAAVSTATRAAPVSNSNPHMACPKFVNNKPSSSRQSTLDRFVGLKEVKHVVQEEVLCNDEVEIDPEAAQTWIYPEYPPVRDYQLSITKTALFSNTLVSLPTGLGKTFIAAVVMYNYSRWFPKGKIVFAAPSRPLVVQQIRACHEIVGISQDKQLLQKELPCGKINKSFLSPHKFSKRIYNLEHSP